MNTEQTYAGFWIRVCAYCLDSLILTIIFLPIILIATFYGEFSITDGSEAAETSGFFSLILFFIYLIVGIAYVVGIPSTSWQATPGKRLLGIYIINDDGSKPSFWKILGRTLIGHLLCTILLYCGYILIGFHAKKKGLHDILFNTLVVYGKPNIPQK